jgi:sigma-B regulation protein RsbQ
MKASVAPAPDGRPRSEPGWDTRNVDVRRKNNVKVVGDGPTVMLAHGFGCDQNLWRFVTERLAPNFRVVLFDHVGSGASDPSA